MVLLTAGPVTLCRTPCLWDSVSLPVNDFLWTFYPYHPEFHPMATVPIHLPLVFTTALWVACYYPWTIRRKLSTEDAGGMGAQPHHPDQSLCSFSHPLSPVLCPQVPGPGWALCATCHSTASPSRAPGQGAATDKGHPPALLGDPSSPSPWTGPDIKEGSVGRQRKKTKPSGCPALVSNDAWSSEINRQGSAPGPCGDEPQSWSRQVGRAGGHWVRWWKKAPGSVQGVGQSGHRTLV